MSAPVSPVCGRAGARLSIFTASTGPSADTGSPVNGENSWPGTSAAGFAGVPGPGCSTTTIAATSPMTATAAETPIMTFRRGHLTTPTSTTRLIRAGPTYLLYHRLRYGPRPWPEPLASPTRDIGHRRRGSPGLPAGLLAGALSDGRREDRSDGSTVWPSGSRPR